MKLEDLDKSDQIKVLKCKLLLQQRSVERLKERFEKFVGALLESLNERYQLCEDGFATPSSILLSVLNAVEDARQKSSMCNHNNG